jgi:dinuclear metal center YbgI/SA1388 family protein
VPLSELVHALEEIAPLGGAASWDNVGLLVGDASQSVSRVLLAIDCTEEVLAEAKAAECEAVIAYHPPIFGKLDRVVRGGAGGLAGALVYDAIRSGIAIYSPHTALDVADGGTNDALADALAMKDRAPLSRSEEKDHEYKLVYFVPESAAEAVSAAVFDAGAGRIGAYSSCSFRSPGTGTFFGEAGASPAVGERGRLERVDELRVETVVPIACVAPVLAALRASHPYEEPAFDLVRLASRSRGKGMGRIGTIEETTRAALITRVKEALGVERVLVAGPLEGTASRVAVCAGSCGDLVFEAVRQKADLYLTGELRHHDALRAAAGGITVVCTLHSASERPVLSSLGARLARALPHMAFIVSRADRDPFRFA